VLGVHWSEAETLARKRRTEQAQGLARKGRRIDSPVTADKRYNVMNEARGRGGWKLLEGRTFANYDRFTQMENSLSRFMKGGTQPRRELWRNSFENARTSA